MNEDNKFEIIKFIDGDFSLDIRISPFDETVWLTQKEMALLFEVYTDNIGLHIKNIFRLNELNESVSEYSSVTASDGKKYKTKIYNLDMILAVGYRIKSKRTSKFREWALKEIENFNTKKNQ